MQILDLSFWQEAIRGLGALLCKVIYWLIALLYELFATISRVNILSSDEIAPIYQRVTMILTIIMVFYVTFEFIKYIVQPDTITDKEKGVGNIAIKSILVILLIAFLPTIFSTAYKLQNRLLETQVFSKIILGKEDTDMSSFGKSFSADMFSVFYKVNEEACSDGCEATSIVEFNLERLRREGDLKYLDLGINASTKVTSAATGKKEDIPLIQFDGLEAIVVGALIVYILLLYCIDVGTRYAQMVFLQIISPIAIMGYLAPKKDNMFSKWTKQCVTTYIDLFIRIAIIYFILLICQILKEAYNANRLFEGIEVSNGIKTFAYIAIIMGLLVFASRAPKMLKELFPSSGSAAGIGFGLRTPSQVLKDAPYLGRTLGGVYAGTGSMLRNTRKSAGKVYEAVKGGNVKDALKWVARATLGNVGAGLTGVGLGLGATDVSGWKKATKNAYDRSQAKYKIHDAGYKPIGTGSGRFWKDQFRGILMMDEEIEDMAKASDLAIQNLQQQLVAIQQDPQFNPNNYTMHKSKATGEYVLYNEKGVEIGRNATGEFTGVDEKLKKVADLNSQLGKETAKNKALHQKENESQEKK